VTPSVAVRESVMHVKSMCVI